MGAGTLASPPEQKRRLTFPGRPAGLPRVRGQACPHGLPGCAAWPAGRTTRWACAGERDAGIIWTFVCEKICTHLCVHKYICFSEAYLEGGFICNKRFSECNPEHGICRENTRTQEKGFDTKHKAVIEVFMPKCTVNQTYGGIYRLVGLFERFGRSVLISQK